MPGALLAYYVSPDFDAGWLLSFAAGNFLYIAASDLIPEVKHNRLLYSKLIHFGAFVIGVSVIPVARAIPRLTPPPKPARLGAPLGLPWH